MTALRKQIERQVAIAMQLQSFGHEEELEFDGKTEVVFTVTAEQQQAFDRACDNAAERVIELLITEGVLK